MKCLLSILVLLLPSCLFAGLNIDMQTNKPMVSIYDPKEHEATFIGPEHISADIKEIISAKDITSENKRRTIYIKTDNGDYILHFNMCDLGIYKVELVKKEKVHNLGYESISEDEDFFHQLRDDAI